MDAFGRMQPEFVLYTELKELYTGEMVVNGLRLRADVIQPQPKSTTEIQGKLYAESRLQVHDSVRRSM